MKKIALAIFAVVLTVCLAVGIAACSGGKVTIELNKTTLTLEVGESETLKATTSDGSSVVWSTSDKEIASVDSRGKVTAQGAGSATITATSGDVTAECEVTVTAKPVITISGLEETATVERGQTITLEATASDNSAIRWVSSDTKIATVSSEGVVTGVFPGETTIIATTESGGRAECTLTVTNPAGTENWYQLQFGEEGKLADKTWTYWNDQGWVNSTVTIVDYPEYLGDSEGSEAGAIHFAYTSVGENWFGFQIFYKDESVPEGTYKLTCDIEIDVAGTITLNGNHIELTAGENKGVEAVFAYGGTSDCSYFDLQMGYMDETEKQHMISAAEVTISNMKWESVETVALVAPSVEVAADGTVTITDTNTVGVGSYTVGLFLGEETEPKYTFAVASGDKIDTSMVEGGTYTVKVMAVAANAQYTSSEWSAEGAEFVVEEHEIAYDLTGSAETEIGENRWYFWSEYDKMSGRYENGTLSVSSTDAGGNWYSCQLFYKNTGLVAGQNYTLTMTITSSVSGTITVCGQAVELEANVAKDVTVTIAGGANTSIQLGTNDGGPAFGAVAVNLTITDIEYTLVQA